MEYVEIPEQLILLLSAVLTVAITQLLKYVGEKLNYPLEGYAAQVVASIVAALLVLANAVFSNVPVEFVPVVNTLLQLLVVSLASFGAYDAFLSKRPKG